MDFMTHVQEVNGVKVSRQINRMIDVDGVTSVVEAASRAALDEMGKTGGKVLVAVADLATYETFTFETEVVLKAEVRLKELAK